MNEHSTAEQVKDDALFRFAEGFPTPQGGSGALARMVETVAGIRAYQRGIRYLEAQDAMLSVEQGFRCDGLMPVVTDYMTHVLAPTVEWRFRSGMEEELVKRYVESMDSEAPWGIQQLSEAVRDQVNRPALVNIEADGALMDARTTVRDEMGTPFSVTLLMLDMAVENMHEFSKAYQRQLFGEELNESLDLTPTFEMLTSMEAHPRAALPQNVRERAMQRQNAAPTQDDEIRQNQE